MKRNDVEKFLAIVKDNPFAIWLRYNNDEDNAYQIEVSDEVELLEESLIIGEKASSEDDGVKVYWSIINLDDIVEMNMNY